MEWYVLCKCSGTVENANEKKRGYCGDEEYSVAIFSEITFWRKSIEFSELVCFKCREVCTGASDAIFL